MASSTVSPERYRDVGDNKVALEMQVTFAVDSSEITGNFDIEIANVAKFLRENPLMTAVVEGHTDSTGTPQHNLRLSVHRADSVHKMLLEERDINPE